MKNENEKYIDKADKEAVLDKVWGFLMDGEDNNDFEELRKEAKEIGIEIGRF